MSADDRGSEEFEKLVSARLNTRGAATSGEVFALLDFARALPGRKRSGFPRLALLAPLLPVVLLTALAVGLLQGGGATTTATPTTPVAVSATPSALVSDVSSPVPSLRPSLPDPAAWSNDPRLASCGQAQTTPLLTVVQLLHASDYAQRVPSLGYEPDLAKPDSVLVLVYAGSSPIDLSLGDSKARTHSPASGTHDICVGAAGWHMRFQDVTLDFAVLTGVLTPSTTVRTPNTLAILPGDFGNYGTNLVWDSARRSLWYAYVGCGTASSIHSLDPSNGATQQWTIPSNTFGNCQAPKLVLDASDVLWVMESSWLVRFDPQTDKLQSVRVAPESVEPSRTSDSRSFPTAIAADGSSVLIARINTPTLTRVGADMTLSTIAVPVSASGATNLAVTQGRIFVSAGSDLLVLSSNGDLISSGISGAGTLAVRPDGRVVILSSRGSATLLTNDGAPETAISLPGSGSFTRNAFGVASDWSTRSWFVALVGPEFKLFESRD
jgi:hypothetical protein